MTAHALAEAAVLVPKGVCQDAGFLGQAQSGTFGITGGKAIQSIVALGSQVALGNRFKFSSPQPQRNPSFLPRSGTM